MKNIFFVLLATLLAACVAQPAAPTATVTPPPAMTITPSAIPTASVTPTPTEAPLPDGIKDLQEKLKETDYVVGWSNENKDQMALFYVDPKTKEKQEIQEITVNPDGSWTRAYNLPDIEEKFVVEGTIADVEVILDEDGTKNLGFYNWKVEVGKLTKKTAQFATKIEGETVEQELTSVEEVNYEILKNSSSNPKDRIDSREAATNLSFKLLGMESGIYLNYNGLHELSYNNKSWGDNIIHGQDTAFFVVIPIKSDAKYGLVAWIDAKEIGQVRIIDKEKLNIYTNFSDWYLTNKP